MSVVNTNFQALSAARTLNQSQVRLGRSLTRLSSGSKIVNPSDDVTGLAASEKSDAQSRRVQAATTNVQNAVSYVQAADGFMGGMTKILSRMSELAAMAQDVTKNSSDVASYEQEFQSLQNELRTTVGGTTNDIGGTADVSTPLGTFNGLTLFGPGSTGLTVTIGPTAGEDMTVPSSDLCQGSTLAIIHQDNAGAYDLKVTDPNAISTITGAIQQMSTERATLGASQSRLELTGAALQGGIREPPVRRVAYP